MSAWGVVSMVNGLRKHHHARHSDIGRVAVGLTQAQRQRIGLGLPDKEGVFRINPNEIYNHLNREFLAVTCALVTEAAGPGFNAHWFMNSLIRAGVPAEAQLSYSVAVDGTAIKGWGRFLTPESLVNLDGEQDGLSEEAQEYMSKQSKKVAREKRRKEHEKLLTRGDDDRLQYTTDPDARAGWRTGSNKEPGRLYAGYEPQLIFATRDASKIVNPTQVTLGADVAPYMLGAHMMPAGAYRADVVTELKNIQAWLRQRGATLTDVVWDAGFSLLRPEATIYALGEDGIHQTYQPASHQLNIRRVVPSTWKPERKDGESDNEYDQRLLDLEGDPEIPFEIGGWPFSHLIPEKYLELTPPAWNADDDEKMAYEKMCNERDNFRYRRNSKSVGNAAGSEENRADGSMQFECPVHAGRVQIIGYTPTGTKVSLKKGHAVIEKPAGFTRCCKRRTFTMHATDLPRIQDAVPGTTAWRLSYGRRGVSESGNAMLKGQFIDVDSKYFEVMSMVKVSVMLAFGFAGYNAEVTRREKVRASWLAKQVLREAEGITSGAKRANKGSRKGTRVAAIARYVAKNDRRALSKAEERRRESQRKAALSRPTTPPADRSSGDPGLAPNTAAAMGRRRTPWAGNPPPPA